MLVSNHTLKRLSGGIAVAALVVAVAVPSAFASPDAFGRAVAIHNAKGMPPQSVQPYVNAGMSPAVATSNDVRLGAPTVVGSTGGTGFNWGDAGIGAGLVAGLALLLLIGASRVRGHKGRVLAA
jgi:hypothetical protein